MNGKSRPEGGSQTPTKKSATTVRPTARDLLRDARRRGDTDTARLLAYLIGGAS